MRIQFNNMHTEDLNNANHKAVKNYNNIICAVGGVAIVQGDLSYLQLAMHSLSHLFFFQNVEFFILVHIKLAFLIYALLTKLVRSRWLDIGQVLFLHFYRPR